MLRITKLTDYATVVLTVLASDPEAVASAAGLAERAGLEVPTVAKVLKPLAQAGLVEAFRGANGGYRLARAPAEISLIQVVEAMEGPLGMTECSLHAGACGLERSCGVRANWRRINDVVADALRGISLAQMLSDISFDAIPSPSMAKPDSRQTDRPGHPDRAFGTAADADGASAKRAPSPRKPAGTRAASRGIPARLAAS